MYVIYIIFLQVHHILANDSVYFPSFKAEEFRQDVHWSVYHCVASNTVGTIVSRYVVVKAGMYYKKHKNICTIFGKVVNRL